MKIVDENLGNFLDQVDLKDRTADIKYYQYAQNEIGYDGSEINDLQATKSPKIKDLLSKNDWTNSNYSLLGLILFKFKI